VQRSALPSAPPSALPSDADLDAWASRSARRPPRQPRRWPRPAGRGVAGALTLLLMLAVIWLTSPAIPTPAVNETAPRPGPREILEGRVLASELAPAAPAPDTPAPGASPTESTAEGTAATRPVEPAKVLSVLITSGSQRGRTVRLLLQDSGVVSVPAAARQYLPGDQVVLAYQPDVDAILAGGQATEDESTVFQLVDHRRWPWLIWGALAFAVGIVGVAGRQGLRALIGLASAVCVLWWFVIPRLLTGAPPVPLALAGCALIAIPSLLLTHGTGRHGIVPLLGVGGSLLGVGVLTVVAVQLAKLTGFATSEEMILLYAGTNGAIDARGLLLAGMLIGVVGGLVDVTVAQSAAVFEFHEGDPGLSRLALFRRGMNVGRAHVAAAVHTLVLAYAGAALPTLLLLAMYASFMDTIWNRELIVAEVLRAVAGCLGLAAAMPLTTWLACLACRPAAAAAGAASAGTGALPARVAHSH
jgi:uncharacterized membrane protein